MGNKKKIVPIYESQIPVQKVHADKNLPKIRTFFLLNSAIVFSTKNKMVNNFKNCAA